jgi:putative membrane protein
METGEPTLIVTRPARQAGPTEARQMATHRRRVSQVALAACGLALLGFVIARYGWRDVTDAFLRAGWGIFWVSLAHFGPIACDMLGWRELFPPAERVGLARLFVFRWVGESVNNLLPVAQVGGDVIRARLAARAGASLRESGAATVVDFTIGLVTQMGVALVALGVLAGTVGISTTLGGILLGIALFCGLIGGFVAAQVWGIFRRAGRFAAHVWERLGRHSVSGALDRLDAVDGSIRAAWRRRTALARCAVWRAAGWIAGTAEIWLATYYLDQPVGVAEAFVLHALTMAIRSIAFLVPAGLGVQEGGFVLVGRLLGLSGTMALAVALVRRSREIIVGVPGLVAWWWSEGRGPVQPSR